MSLAFTFTTAQTETSHLGKVVLCCTLYYSIQIGYSKIPETELSVSPCDLLKSKSK